MKIVMTGLGDTGRYLAEVLLKEGHDLALIEKSSRVVKEAQEQFDAQIVQGDGANALVLEPLIDETTDLFIALTDKDESNVIATLIARRFGAKRAIVRVSDPANLIHPLLTDDPEVTMINAEMVVSRDLTRLIGNPSADEIEFFANGKAEMVRLHVSDGAPVLGVKLAHIKIPSSWLLVAVVRKGHFQIVTGDVELQAKDQVIAIGDPAKYREMEQLLGLRAEKVKRVVAIGMNAITSKLAQAITRRGIEFRVIEENKILAEKAAAELDHVLIIRGDATSDEILEQAGVDQADYVVVLTNDDENNVLISLLVKERGVPRVVSLIQKPQYKRIIDKIGIDAVVSPRSAMVDEIIRCLKRGSLTGVQIFEGGNGRIMEFTILQRNKVTDIPLSKIKLPSNCIIGAIVRGEEVIIPRGPDRIRVGDKIVVFSTEANHKQVEQLFSIK